MLRSFCKQAILFILGLFLLQPAVQAADESSCVFRTTNVPIYCNSLGVGTIPVYVQAGSIKYPGLYLTTAPDASGLAKHMGLKQGNVLLQLDGYSIATTDVADKWMSKRPQKPLQYTYAVIRHGKPTLYTREISSLSSSQSAGQAASTGTANSAQQASAGKEYSIEELERYDLSLINASRRQEGASDVQIDSALSRLAKDYAEYMMQHPERYAQPQDSPHRDLQGRWPMDRARDAGINREVHENLNMVSRGVVDDRALVDRMHQRMMAEPKGQHNHRSILLDAEAKSVGIGISRQGTRMYMVEEFGH